MDYSIVAIIIMILLVVALDYYVNEMISNQYYTSDNLNRSFNALFVGIQIGIIQLLYVFYTSGNLDTPQIILGSILVLASIYVGYKLINLDYLISDKEIASALLEQRGLTLSMAQKSKPNDPRLQKIINKINTTQGEEIKELQDILKDL